MSLLGVAGVLFLLAGAMVAGLWAAIPDQLALQRVPTLAPARSLTVAIEDGALPLSDAGPDGRPTGLHVSVARAVCKRMDVECAFAVTAADRLLDGLETGAVDMVAADLAITLDRSIRVRFLRPYARTASLLVGRAGSWPDSVATGLLAAPTAADLAGRVLVSASGTDQARSLSEMVPPGATLALAQTPRDCIAALHRGEADAALLPLALALDVLASPNGADLIALGPPQTQGLAGGPVALAVATGDGGLAAAANAALTALDRDGTLRALARTSADPTASLIPPLSVEAAP